MKNYRQAPALYYDKDLKMQDKSGYGFVMRSQDLEYAINRLTTVGEIKLMLFLTANAGDGSFKVPEATVLDRCGISERTYDRAKKSLKEKGWITCEAGKSITVNLDVILQECQVDTPENKKCQVDTPKLIEIKNEKCQVDTPEKCQVDTPNQCQDDTYNNINNNINNKIEENEFFVPQNSFSRNIQEEEEIEEEEMDDNDFIKLTKEQIINKYNVTFLTEIKPAENGNKRFKFGKEFIEMIPEEEKPIYIF